MPSREQVIGRVVGMAVIMLIAGVSAVVLFMLIDVLTMFGVAFIAVFVLIGGVLLNTRVSNAITHYLILRRSEQ